MPTFIPPIRSYDSPVLQEDRNHVPAKFFDKGAPRGANVWVRNDGTLTETYPGLGKYTKLYHGGHIHTVTDEEAAVLTAAGYTVT